MASDQSTKPVVRNAPHPYFPGFFWEKRGDCGDDRSEVMLQLPLSTELVVEAGRCEVPLESGSTMICRRR